MPRGDSAGNQRHKAVRIKRAGEAITAGRPVGDTPRTFNYRMRLILTQQVALFYGATYSDAGFTDKDGVRRRIEEFHDDFKDLVQRLASYMGQFARDQKARQRNTLLVRHCLEVLGLDPDSTYDLLAVRSQYRKMAREVHPDRNGSKNPPGESPSTMADLNEAYEYLKEML
jgi:hypothetical protein